MIENQTKSKSNDTLPENGIFSKLAAITLILAISSSVSFLLSFHEGRLSLRPGSPSDEAILYSFLYGLAIAHVINLFLPRGNVRILFSLSFAKVLMRSLMVVGPIWIVLAWGGSLIIDEMFSRTGWEREWFQISLVLLSASLTFACWHVMYHPMPFRGYLYIFLSMPTKRKKEK